MPRSSGAALRTTLPPRAVLVHRRTELTELLDRHGTRGQAEFFLRIARPPDRGRRRTGTDCVGGGHRGRQRGDPGPVAASHASSGPSCARFVFEPGDVVWWSARTGWSPTSAKYLDGQPVIGINPEPGRNPGVLVRHPPAAAACLLALPSAGAKLVTDASAWCAP